MGIVSRNRIKVDGYEVKLKNDLNGYIEARLEEILVEVKNNNAK